MKTNTKRDLSWIGFIAVTVVCIWLLLVSQISKAQEAPDVTIEALPVTCMAPETAKELIDGRYDTMMIAGRSEVTQAPTVVLYNKFTGDYVILIYVQERVCIVDIGKGKTGVFGREV